MPAEVGHLEESERVIPHVPSAPRGRKGREVVSAGFFFFFFTEEEVSRCPGLRLLIYEPQKEISHLSLFIHFLHHFFFLSSQ